MTAEQIREYIDQHIEAGHLPQEFATFRILGEIAAQLAEYNERNARAEKVGLELAQRSMNMMERTEKELDKV